MSPRPPKPQIVTANDLLTGEVVYLSETGEWRSSMSDARIFEQAEEAGAALDAAKARQDALVGPYLAEVRIADNGKALPAHFREAFRASGPSNYFHGKQANR